MNHSLSVLAMAVVSSLFLLACSTGRPARSDGGGGPDVASDMSTNSFDRPVAKDNGVDDGGGDRAPSVTGNVASGQPCLAGSECQSGFCVDSVCCATVCDGTCVACTEPLTGVLDGTCAPVKAGMDPHDRCALAAPESCGTDGTCDGTGSCRKFGPNQICAEASCTGATFNPVRTCDGLGLCAAAAGVACGAYPCTTVGCAKPCATDAECGTGAYCAVGQCKAKKSNGDACAAAGECSSTFCVDGVCCQTSCLGTCTSCAEADTGQKSGSCQPIASGKDPGDECLTDLPATCGRDGTCDGKGGCRKYDAATKCADAACAGSMFTPARTCAGGTCAAAAAVDCKQTACTTAGCQAGCTKDADCAAGAYCAGTSCAARKSNGEVCTVANECTSKACVDGVCCGTACTGLCYACSMDKTDQASGKCAPTTAGTDADNECAATAKTSCGTEGTCDGAGACKLWAKGTECAAGMCNSAGNFLSARTCDGGGTCVAATTDVCAPSICAATGCVRTCTRDTDCVGNTYCGATGMCTAKKTGGAACTASTQCQLGFCVDGVCCNTACNGVCVSCRAADNGQPADGTCAAVSTGKDPANECAVSGGACGLDGFCGGSKCRFAPTTVSCAGTVCSNATLTAAKSCDGNGACPPTGSSSPCPGNVVCASATACKSPTCTANTDCIAGLYCAAGTCAKAKLNGSVCSASAECAGGICVDGVCCNRACNGACEACNVTGSAGQCTSVTSRDDDHCQGLQTCDASGTCRNKSGQTCSGATECATGFCVDSKCCTKASCGVCGTCTGTAGACVVLTQVNCFPDADGDGFGSSSGSKQFCVSCPAGWASSSTDCNDSDPAVKPTADYQDHIEVNGWDWNCSGKIEKLNSPGLLTGCSPVPACQDVRMDDVSLCGTAEFDVRCAFDSGSGQCVFTDPVETGRTIRCR